jgi:hypothetical protein
VTRTGGSMRMCVPALLAMLAVVWLAGSDARAQVESGPIAAQVEVLEPISLSGAIGPDMGTIVLGSDAVTCQIRLTPGGNETVEQGTCGIVDPGLPGSIDVAGTDGASAQIVGDVTSPNCDGAGAVRLSMVVLSLSGGVPSNTRGFTLDFAGAPIGAIIEVDSTALPGVHNSCMLTITASYN